MSNNKREKPETYQPTRSAFQLRGHPRVGGLDGFRNVRREPVPENGHSVSYSKRRRCTGRIEGCEGYRIITPLALE